MQGLVLYNGSSKNAKTQIAALKLLTELEKRNVKMQAVRNNQILNQIDNNNKSKLIFPKNIEKPDFLIAWDKDVKLIEMIEANSIRSFNNSESIKVCDDKSLMHMKILNEDVKIPKTIISPLVYKEYDFDKDYYDNIIENLGEEFILKENCGSFGMQVYKVDSFETFIKITNSINNNGFILQENIKSSFGRDIRVNIIGDEFIGAMLRTNDNDFRANITLGGKTNMFTPEKEVLDLALKVHKRLGLDFSGIDILFDEDEKPILCEINSNPNYLSFEELSGINFAGLIADHVVGKMK